MIRLTIDVQVEGDLYHNLPPDEVEKLVQLMAEGAQNNLVNARVQMGLRMIHPNMGMLVYYMKVPAPTHYNEPTESQFEEFRNLPGASVGEAVTYEEFKALCKMSYDQAVNNGFGLTVQTRATEYTDDAQLEQIKNDIRKQDGFVAFPGDPILDEIIVPIEEMIKNVKGLRDANSTTQDEEAKADEP